MNRKRILVIGGGAAGYFAAIKAAEENPRDQIVIAEAGSKPLQKVAISGGGRCNLTNASFDTSQLAQAYPRGHRELRGPFSRFQASDTIEWFKSRGVELKTEEDGRVFPTTDSSGTIIDCFENARAKLNIDLRLRTKVQSLQKAENNQLKANFSYKTESSSEDFDSVLLASGGAKGGYEIAKFLGHTIEPCVPSLFTFEVKDRRLEGLSGVSMPNANISLSVPNCKTFRENGPLLVTHWGFSGPAVIKLSAWAARALHENNYQGQLTISWCPRESQSTFTKTLERYRQEHPKRAVQKNPICNIPKRLWENLCEAAEIEHNLCFTELSRQKAKNLEREIFNGSYKLTGKGVFKEEFVTCGGVRLSEVDFRTMQSKLVPGLFFAGEILDIDGITGGYNFQSAWTTGFIAGQSMS